MSYNDHAGMWIKHARGGSRFYQYLERPAMRSLLPEDLSGKSVLCLGVGSGEETEVYTELGAESITAYDNAPKLIEAARQLYPQHTFGLMDLNNLQLESETYDVAASHMAMHYAADWREVLRRIYTALKPSGIFVFSTHNPVWWSAEKINSTNGFAWVVGVETNTKQHTQTVLGQYGVSGTMTTEIIKDLETEYYHRPFAEMIQTIIDSPFKLEQVLEPKPIQKAKLSEPVFYRVMNGVPIIAVFRLKKSA